MKLNTFLLTASLGLAATPGAWAAIIFDSLSATGNTASASPAGWSGASFRADALYPTFRSVQLRMLDGTGESGDFFVRLYDATGPGSKPGALLATLAGEANPIGAGDYTYTGAQALIPNSIYWIVGGVLSGDRNYTLAGQSGAYLPSVGTSIGISASINQGSTWIGPVPAFLAMQVDAVPEPSSWAMMGVTLCGAAGFLIRQRRAKAARSTTVSLPPASSRAAGCCVVSATLVE